MKFLFKAKGSTGEVREGSVEAMSREAVAQILQSNGLIPLSIEEEKKNSDVIKDIKRIWEGASQRKLAVFLRQFATLIDAKVPVVTSLQTIGEQTENKYFKLVIDEIVLDVKDGMSLSDSLSKHPTVFTQLMVSMVRAGEVSGNLQKSLAFLAENTEKNYELTNKIKSALFYPGFILTAAVIIGFIVFTIVIPKLTAIFADMEIELPWYTKMIISSSNFARHYWWLIVILIIGAVLGVMYYIKTDSGKREWDQWKLKIPVFGALFRDLYMVRFAENLAVLLTGGTPVVRALIIVADVVNNDVYKSVILRAADEVKTGGAMSLVFARSREFPPIIPRMIKIGEDSGKIQEVLKNVAEFYERETDRMTRNMTTLIEPILIVILGIGVAILVFTIFMPIYNIAGQIK